MKTSTTVWSYKTYSNQQAIEKQLADCKAIIDKKNALIEMLTEELKNKDDDYVKSIKRMDTDINLLLERMRKQYTTLRESYERELKNIETEYLNERAQLLKSNKQDIDELFTRHEKVEQSLADARAALEKKFDDDMEIARTKNTNEYQSIKINLETDLQSLEKYLEDVKAVSQINEERLKFSIKVLEQKQEANDKQLKVLKGKEEKLKKLRTIVKHNYEKQDADAKNRNAKLTEDFKRATKQFKELQKKFKHFEESDKQRYQQILSMKKEEVRTLLNKTFSADNTIHVQQLGLPYNPKSHPVLKFLEETEQNLQSTVVEPSKTMLNKSDKDEQSSQSIHKLQEKVSLDRIIRVFDFITSGASYLVDHKTMDEIKNLDQKDRYEKLVECMCKTLSIDISDIELLVNTYEETMKKREIDPADITDSDRVITVMWEFLERRKDMIEKSGANSPNQRNRSDLMENKKKKEYKVWEELSNVFDHDSESLWKTLDSSLGKYYQLLVDRQNLIEETGLLNQQNEELKTLLNQYMQATVNKELLVPPTQVIKLDI